MTAPNGQDLVIFHNFFAAMNPSYIISRLSVWIGIPASGFGIAFAVEKYWNIGSSDARLGLILLAIFAAIFLAWAVFQEFRYSRKARYAESLSILNSALQIGYDGSLKSQNETDPTKITQTVREICNILADAFSLITGTRCAVCVKMLDDSPNATIEDNSPVGVATLCRDYISDRKRNFIPSKPNWLDRNTDFDEMFRTIKNPGGGTFFGNYLPGLYGYNNTSFEFYNGPPTEISVPIIRGIVRRMTWNLPYKSTIGAVIFPTTPKDEDLLAGFLCIDSASSRNFRARYDVDLLRTISAAIYPMIMRWYEIAGSES